MKISTKGRYALRLMLDIAIHATDEVVSARTIAQRQALSEKYLEQIISMLTRAGFVVSTRGARGGYQLARAPQEYTVGMILRLTEGSLAPVTCLQEDVAPCERAEFCATLVVWKKLYNAINDVVDNITLADLVKIEEQQGMASVGSCGEE